MPSRLRQLMQQLEDAKRKGDTDKIDILQQELFILRNPRVKKISENDMTDYPIGEGKEYPGNPDMPRIRNTLPPGFGEPQEIKKGGMTKGQKKVGKVMREFKKGELHSGKKGPVVKSRKQAIAIALSEAGMSKPKEMSIGGEVQLNKGRDYIKDLI